MVVHVCRGTHSEIQCTMIRDDAQIWSFHMGQWGFINRGLEKYISYVSVIITLLDKASDADSGDMQFRICLGLDLNIGVYITYSSSRFRAVASDLLTSLFLLS